MTAAESSRRSGGASLAFERAAPAKHEYVAGEVFAISGASLRHNAIVAPLVTLVGQALRGGPWGVFPSDLKVHVASREIFTYPDVSVVCGYIVGLPRELRRGDQPEARASGAS